MGELGGMMRPDGSDSLETAVVEVLEVMLVVDGLVEVGLEGDFELVVLEWDELFVVMVCVCEGEAEMIETAEEIA